MSKPAKCALHHNSRTDHMYGHLPSKQTCFRHGIAGVFVTTTVAIGINEVDRLDTNCAARMLALSAISIISSKLPKFAADRNTELERMLGGCCFTICPGQGRLLAHLLPEIRKNRDGLVCNLGAPKDAYKTANKMVYWALASNENPLESLSSFLTHPSLSTPHQWPVSLQSR